MKNGCREKVVSSTHFYKLLHLITHAPVLGILTTLLLLPALFSCNEYESAVTKVSVGLSEGSGGQLDIFTFNTGKTGHLESYQHHDSHQGQLVELSSESGEKRIFICSNGQRDIYGWAGISSFESLDKIQIELCKETRANLCATGSGTINAGGGTVQQVVMRKMASEVVLNSLRCDFSDKAYEGEPIRNVRVYLTNVTAQCPITAEHDIVPSGIVNGGRLDMEDLEMFADPSILYRSIDREIDSRKAILDLSFICYPNESRTEGPGTPFTRLVIEGTIRGETFWWPISINRSADTQSPGISRNCRYAYDITITGKGTSDPDIPISAEMAEISMNTSPWREMEERKEMFSRKSTVVIEVPDYGTKAVMPDENAVNDMNLITFRDGTAEDIIWRRDDEPEFEISMIEGSRYSVLAVANMGRKLEIGSIDELGEIIYGLEESDGYRNGMPMCAFLDYIRPEDGGRIRMELERMAAKVSVRMDRSRLSEDVQMVVKGIRIGNCPRYATIIGPSGARSHHDVFTTGFELEQRQCLALNQIGYNGLSDEISVYMLENMQGRKADDRTASYIEMEIDYRSPSLISYDSPLIYRFYIKDEDGYYDIERNCHYHVTVVPEDDGLSGEGWRVDKSGIGPSTPYFRIMPGEYIEGHVGDTIRVWCECYPRTAPFDPGYEELNYDKNRGIYDYKVDDDQHGVTLYLKKSGTGIVYMSAGSPINRSGMAIIYVSP